MRLGRWTVALMVAALVLAGSVSSASARQSVLRTHGSGQAHRPTAKQRARIRRQLLRQIKRNPRVALRRSFLKQASLVNFVLPITIRLRTPCAASPTGCNTDGTALNQVTVPSATVALGPSLGQRTINLGGSLAGEVLFHDSYDGGALGNVSIKLLPSTSPNKQLHTSSVPLLWNPDISDPNSRGDVEIMKAVRSDPSYGSTLGAFAAAHTQGCGDWQAQDPPAASTYNPASTHNPFKGNTRATNPIISTALTGIPPGDGTPGYDALFADTPYDFNLGTGIGIPGFPYYDVALPPAPNLLVNVTQPPDGFLPIYPGVDRIDNLTSGDAVGDNEVLGPAQTPFPYSAAVTPGGFPQPPNVRDTILRTNALSLGIAPAGIQVDQATGTSDGGPLPGPQGSQNVITGASGGEANLFGNIPGKDAGIDVTVNLSTQINSIIRIHSQDVFRLPLLAGQKYPAGLFGCRQVWTGAVQNYIPGVRLKGDLRIAPAITKDGKLRIAKATVSSPADSTTGVALSACVMPYSAYVENNSNPLSVGYTTDASAAVIPNAVQTLTGFPPLTGFLLVPYNSNLLPGILDQRRYSGGGQISPRGPAPSNVPCNTTPTDIIRGAGLTGLVDPQSGVNNIADGYSTNVDGSHVSVRGDIKVNPIEVDVLIGDN